MRQDQALQADLEQGQDLMAEFVLASGLGMAERSPKGLGLRLLSVRRILTALWC